MGDSVSNQGEITPKGVDGSIQLAAGGDLKSVDGVTVTDAGKLTAVIFSGDGGLLSNVSGGGGGVGDLQQVSDTGNTTSNTIQFTNTITSLTTSGNVAVNGATTTDAILSVKSDTSAVLALESETALSGIGFKTSTTTSGGAVPALGVSGDNIVFYPGVPAALAVTIDADKDMTVVGNVSANKIIGDGSELTNTTDASEGTYGDSSTVAAITVNSDGRIDSISAISISFPAETQSLQDVTDNGPTTTNEVSFTNSPNSLTASSNITVTGNVNAGYLWGEGSNITNTVDASEGTYGDGGSNVAVIVVSPDGRIDSISNTEITTSNLQQVTDTGNITSNIIQFTNTGTSIKTSGLANIANLEVYGTHTELSDLSGTTLTVDAQGHSYRTANVRTAGNSINTLSISNLKRSAQMVVYIECTTSASNVSGKGTLTGAKSCHSNIEMSTSDTVVLTLTNDGTTNYASACKFE